MSTPNKTPRALTLPQRSRRNHAPAAPGKLWRPTGSLSRRITRMVALTAACSVLAGSLLSLHNVLSSKHAGMANEVSAAFDTYATLAGLAIDAGDATAADIIVARVLEAVRADGVVLTNKEGAVVAESRRAADEAPPDLSRLPAWERVARSYLPEIRLPQLRYDRSLRAYGDPIGALEVTRSSRPLFEAAAAHMKPFGIVIVLAALFAMLVTMRMRRQISAPIGQLLETMDYVARTQDYSRKVQPDGPDEVGSLIIGFNEMLHQIHSRNLRLADHRRKLQELVLERTRNFEAAAAEAERSSRAKGDFLARMSHEIRTPMNGVVGMAELLENTGLEQTQHRMLSTMRSSADALLEIINDILDFSKIEAGQLQVLRTDFNVYELVEEVCDLLAPRAYERGLELVCDIDRDVPLMANGDPIRLRQIVTNLLGNAIKYTEHGHVIVRLRLEAQNETASVLRFEVEDTGLGIPEEQIGTIFDAFTQGDSFETRKHGGTGLGLAITKQLVTILDGTIDLESRHGAGSRFWVTLPLAKATREGTPPAWDLSSSAILLVQHNELASRATAALLEQAGARVWATQTARRALDQLELDSFQLVLFDQTTPDMTLAAFLDALRASSSAALPVVAMAASSLSPGDGASANSAPDVVMAKPVRRLRLRESIDRALGRGQEGPQQGADAGPARRLLNLKVLLVEDSPVNREVASGMLEALGCRTDTAGDGSLGVDCALGDTYDVVLMDCQMPLMDGFEATRRIRAGEQAAGRRPTPIVAITANALPGDRERCLLSGMDDFISKPFTLKKLQEVLSAVTRTEGTPVDAPPRREKEAGERSRQVLDTSQIDELRALGRPQLIAQAVMLFRQQAETKLADLHAAIAAQDCKEIEAAAHSLKSSSLSVGGRRFALAAGMCEEAGRAGDPRRAQREAASLEPELAELFSALDSVLEATERAA